MFAHEFIRNAYLAGTFIALACGCVGWFVVAPRRSCSPATRSATWRSSGAIAAAVVGLDERVGLFAADAGGGRRDGARSAAAARADDAVIGDRVRVDPGHRGAAARRCSSTSSAGGAGISAAQRAVRVDLSLSAGDVAAGGGDRRSAVTVARRDRRPAAAARHGRPGAGGGAGASR